MIATEEKTSRGPLIAFIDLLFLLVAFFVLLLFFVQQRHQLSEQQLQIVQQNLARITGEQVDVPKALESLEQIADRFVATQQAQQEREHKLAERTRRRAQHDTVRLEYTIAADGHIRYDGKSYDIEVFLKQVVEPLRKQHWVGFRAYAAPETPFGAVVEHRQALLQDASEFDTYWDNVPRQEPPAADTTPPARPPAR